MEIILVFLLIIFFLVFLPGLAIFVIFQYTFKPKAGTGKVAKGESTSYTLDKMTKK